MRNWPWILGALLISGCAVPNKGILLSVEPATPLDERDLHNYCDLGDQAACALSSPEESARPALQFAIIQGVATPDRAVFAAVLPKDSAISWFIYDRDLGRLWKLHDSRKQMRPGNPWYVQRIEARGLEPGRRYELLAGDSQGKLIESRAFRTLSASGRLSFAVVSGLGGLQSGKHDSSGQLLSAAKARNPQFILFTGGNLDASMPKEKLPAKRAAALDFFFERHLAARNALGFSRQRDLVPVAATWNEWEFGLKRGDRSFVFRDQAREVFEMFFPFWADETDLVNGPGVSKSIHLGDHKIVLLDDRSFRVPTPSLPACNPSSKKKAAQKACGDSPGAPPSLAHRFGSMQANWAFQQASRFKNDVWLISAEPWLGLHRSRGSTPANSREWLEQIASRPAPPPISGAGAFAFVEAESGKASLSMINASGATISSREITAN
jgi:hypothetical protein